MNIVQKQCLLAYLGYYVGAIDGKWGTLSKTATVAFQKDFGITADGIAGAETEKALRHAVAYGMPAKEEEDTDSDFWGGIEHFKRSEFACKCGKYCDGFPAEPSRELVELLEKIRKHYGKAVNVNSGIRCQQHNANVGGASRSQHMLGTAADICIADVAPEELAEYIDALIPNTGGIGIYSWGVHVDVRENRTRFRG